MAYQVAKFTRVLDEPDRAVHEQNVHAARVVRAGPNHGDGSAAILIDVVVDAVGPVGRLGVRVNHGRSISPPLTLPLPLLVGAVIGILLQSSANWKSVV